MAEPSPSGQEHPDCCDDLVARGLRTIDPPPGQSSLDRRIGTHSRFHDLLVARLGRHAGTRRLTARTPDDFAIALLDGWATVADTVTFYTERFANEHYVATATERRSMSELARLIGRTLRPGLAAEVDLAFAMETAPGAPTRLELPAGTAVQSDPEPGADPAVFETLAPTMLRPGWNRMRARATQPAARPSASAGSLRLAGAATGVRLGDGVAYRDATGTARFGVVTAVDPVDEVPATPTDPGRPGHTTITLTTPAVVPTGLPGTAPVGSAPVAAPLTGVAAAYAGQQVTAAELDASLADRHTSPGDLEASLSGSGVRSGSVLHFRTTASLFGAAAPQSTSLAAALKQELLSAAASDSTWTSKVNAYVTGALFPWDAARADTMPGGGDRHIALDSPQPSITADSVVALVDGDQAGVYEVERANLEGLADDGVSARVTRLRLHASTGLHQFRLRSTAVFGEPRELELAEEPVAPPVSGTSIELESLQIGLEAGRSAVVSGQVRDDPGRTLVHVTQLAHVVHDFSSRRSTTITLASAIPDALELARETVTVNANVVRASHGRTVTDVLGNGDGRQGFQRFRLTQRPLTYLSAPTAMGRTSTLRIFVDDVEWSEVPRLVDAGPDDRVFTIRETEQTVEVQFGDGRTGARLPTGAANVRAVYRVGAGAAGRMGAHRLTILASRPAGLASVDNPAPSLGGAEPETAGDARANVAVDVRTLGRVVSLRDYGDFARSFIGIPKAHATWSRSGGRRGVILTVAGEAGAPLGHGDPIREALVGALARSGDELVPVHVASFRPVRFRVVLDLRIDPSRGKDRVKAAVDAALREAFSFAARDLGQDVHASEVLTVAHGVTGVVAADIVLLAVVDPASGSVPADATVPDVLTAATPTAGTVVGGAEPQGAQLLTIEPYPVELGDLP